MPEHTIPESLIDQIKKQRAVLVIGAGVGVASWKQLLERMNEELGKRGQDGDDIATKDVEKLLHKGSLVRAAGFLARTLGEERCDELVKEMWAGDAGGIPPVVKALARLPFRHVWTTFPGDLIERALNADNPEGWPEPRVMTYQEAEDISSRRRTLVKILGDFDSYIVTPRSVRKALSQASDLRDYAREYYVDGTIVFVGFRYGDPDLSALLDRVFGVFEPPRSNHYLIGAGVGPVTIDELGAEHHIEVINLAGKGADEVATSSVVDFLTALGEACTEAGISLSQSRPDEDDVDAWLGLLGDAESAAEARDALDLIERRAREGNDTDRLVEVLLGLTEVEETPTARAARLRQLAEVYEAEVGDLPRAFTALTASLGEDPAETTLDDAERLAGEIGCWSELVTEVSEVAGELKDTVLASRYWARIGRWYDQHLRHVEYAIASYRQAIKLDGKNGVALGGLAEMLRKQQSWSELADVLKTHVDVETAPQQQVDLYLALGDLCETQLASTSRAIDAYQAALDIDESSDDALAALERLYRRDERWGKLARVLEIRAEHFEAGGDAIRAAAVRRELATLRADKLGDMEGAIGKYEAALAGDPTDAAALRALEELYEKVGRTDDYLRTLSRMVEVLPEGERPAKLRRLAAELEDRDALRAAAYYEQLLGYDASAEDAHRALARLLRGESKWYELVSAHERHIAVVKGPQARLELHLKVADVYEKELADPHRAIEAHLNALTIEPDGREPLVALARLYARTENWDRAVEILVKHAGLEGNRGAALWAEAGRIAGEKLADREIAEQHLERALSIDTGNLPSLLALARLHKARASWRNAVECLDRAETASSNRLERIELLLDAAELCENRLDDAEGALDHLHKVLKLDPEHIDAGVRVAERLCAAEKWEDALPVLEMLARRSGDEDRVERGRREANLGRAYEALHRIEKAAKHYRIAVEADADNLEASVGLASMLFAEAKGSDDAERWKEVDRRYREILARHRAGLADGQVVEIWHRLGVTARAIGDDKKADNAFRRALERDPHHDATLSALVELATARADWRTVVEARRDQLESHTPSERAKLLEEIGDIHANHMNDSATALGAYLEALKLASGSHILLHKILDAHSDQKQWRRSVETLDTLAGLETSPARRAKYQYAAAVIARDELADVDLAVDHFNFALDDAPTTPKAFDAIEKLLTDQRDWKNLARAYRKMLKRVGDDAPSEQLLRLWTRLGDVCADHLGDPEAAIAAYEVASSLDPANLERHEQLANLYLDAGETRREDAIEELQTLLQAAPDRVELYRALSTLYQEEHELDKAFCMAQALIFLGVANEHERALFERHRSRAFVPAKRRLTEELWQKSIIHPREDRHLNAVFSSLLGSIASSTAQPASAFNLEAHSKADLDRDSRPGPRVFKYAANVLAIDPVPGLYVDGGDGIRVANIAEKGRLAPSVLLGAPWSDRTDDRELAFELGKWLAYFRPERYLNFALQTLPKLENAFLAALQASGAGPSSEPSADVSKLAAHIKGNTPTAVLEQVGQVAQKLTHRVGNGLIINWRNATELTANRVGLILCDDLETAARVIATEKASTTLPAKERLRDLLAYAVSEPYFAVRRHLAMNVRDEASA